VYEHLSRIHAVVGGALENARDSIGHRSINTSVDQRGEAVEHRAEPLALARPSLAQIVNIP